MKAFMEKKEKYQEMLASYQTGFRGFHVEIIGNSTFLMKIFNDPLICVMIIKF